MVPAPPSRSDSAPGGPARGFGWLTGPRPDDPALDGPLPSRPGILETEAERLTGQLARLITPRAGALRDLAGRTTQVRRYRAVLNHQLRLLRRDPGITTPAVRRRRRIILRARRHQLRALAELRAELNLEHELNAREAAANAKRIQLIRERLIELAALSAELEQGK